MEELARAHAQRQRQSLRDLRPDLPEAFVATVERALDSDPTRRYHSVGDFESALRDSLGVPAARAAVQAPAAVRRPRLGFAFLAAAAALVALIAGLIVWNGASGQGDAAIKSLAVLPLVDQLGDQSGINRAPNRLTTGDAITEQLIATLGQIQSLRTIALGSTLPFRESDRPRSEIAKQLGVDAVLEGTLSPDGGNTDRVKLTARLIAAGHNGVLWTGDFGRPRGELAALLADTARALAGAVQAPLTGAETSRLRQVRSTSPEAEEAYLQGRMHLASLGPEPARRALKSFQRAIAIDPSYSAAHAAAARAYLRLAGTNVLTHNEARLSALAEVRTAFDAGGDVAEAHAALGDIKFLYDWDQRGAEREYRRSLDLNPGFIPARKIFAQMLATRGRFDEALAISEETQQIDPQSIDGLISHGMLLYYKGDLDGASSVAERVLSQDPSSPAGHLLGARVSEAQGRFGDALVMMKRAWELTGDGGVNMRVLVIRLQALSGDIVGARAARTELEREAKNGTALFHARDRALVALGFGETQEALNSFDIAFGERDPALVWLTVDPRVDPLRNEPRFSAMLQKLSVN